MRGWNGAFIFSGRVRPSRPLAHLLRARCAGREELWCLCWGLTWRRGRGSCRRCIFEGVGISPVVIGGALWKPLWVCERGGGRFRAFLLGDRIVEGADLGCSKFWSRCLNDARRFWGFSTFRAGISLSGLQQQQQLQVNKDNHFFSLQYFLIGTMRLIFGLLLYLWRRMMA